MTIDETIKHAREVAERNRKESEYDAFSLDFMNEKHKNNCIKKAEEQEQLAEWLEELKEARKGFNENRKAGYKHGYKDGYAKAIDEFVNKAWETLGSEDSDIYARESILEIAEQMKEGAE